MELIVTVGIPVVCLILGYTLGYGGIRKVIEESFRAGYNAGAEATQQYIVQQLNKSYEQLEQIEKDTENEN